MRVKILRWLALLALAGAMMAAGPSARAGAAIPAECATKTRIVPRTPGWAFVMNFDVLDGTAPRGCLMLYRVVYAPTNFVPVTCKIVGVGSQIAIASGRGVFNGGYVYCDVNIKQKLATLTPPATMPDVDSYPYFTIVAAGTLSSNASLAATANPIGIYTPNTTTVPALGLNIPLHAAQSSQLLSHFNGVTNSTAIRLATGVPYTFTVEHDGGPDVYTTTHYVGNSVGSSIVSQFTPRNAVSFFTNGGTFWIGADPAHLNDPFLGTLDEVIFDPPDGGRPPLYASDQHLIFVPAALRQP